MGAVPVPGYNPPSLPGLHWEKSSRSNKQQLDDSIGLAVTADGGIAIGITTDPAQVPLIATRTKLQAFVEGAKAGEFDHLISA
ncbi:protein of unknown function [Streptomyces sp. TLI_053]|uniref:DUF397 domain-containing protein n=1 Tax=Streptomyces sp. TLI_053 TaxID=1855352 RepID=UPI0008796367|nr:DUF397 domain-containing protein [Streptomyces sp. TLI_053]SDT69900.1 protein of unknown function [Streptomyces sp. TLI_053]